MEEERQNKLAQDTMHMMERFERDHPALEFGEKFRVEGRELIREDSKQQQH